MVNEQQDGLESIEKHIDDTLLGLRIFEMPAQVALEHACTMFEILYEDILFTMADNPISATIAIQQIRSSLQALVPQILRHCRRGHQTIVPEIVGDDLTIAKEAMIYCSKYSELVECFVRYHQYYYEGAAKNKVVTFRHPSDIEFGKSHVNSFLHQYRSNKEGFKSFMIGKKPNLSAKACEQLIRPAIELCLTGSIIPFVPEEVYSVFKQIVIDNAPKPTLDRNIKCQGYTVEDYNNFWIECSAIALLNHYICDQRHQLGMASTALEGRILHLTVEEFANIVVSHSKLERSLVLAMLSDLTLNMDVKRPDLLVQPLVKLPNDERIVITPSLFPTSYWETCLLRNWIITHPEVYGHAVAQKKELLSNEFGDILQKQNFVVTVRQKIRDKSGKTVGDIDVGVLDVKTNHVVLFELKWIIDPDSVYETMRADTEIEEGVQQLNRFKIMLEKEGDFYFKQIFPSESIEYKDVKKLEFYVVGNGNIGSVKTIRAGMRVFDYTMTVDLLGANRFTTLAQFVVGIIKVHDMAISAVAKKECQGQFKLGGFVFRFPAFGDPGGRYYISMDSPNSTGVNAPCVCGSGRKYKKCCRDIDNYIDEAISTEKHLD